MADARSGVSDGVRDGVRAEHGASNGASHGLSDDARDGAEKSRPFEAKQHDPDAWVTVKVRAATRDRFDAWYQAQHPGWKIKLLPEKSPFSDQVFSMGLDQIEALFPPVEMSLAERIAKARASQ